MFLVKTVKCASTLSKLSVMDGLIDFIIENISIKKLDREKAKEALFYIDFLLAKEKDSDKTGRLSNLKAKLLKRMAYLETIGI